ncbi:MAG TPA: prepilin-type N-terminal cleavage/methylation domain-containing protein [Syntrophorhabdaceae bacterium]|nr:prepilin-type N-terminal cleavage/methylation domain-containing protein [Syntrophorhabdaceae bacterium]
MFKSKGFTIIELVIIIVVLGILAVAVLYKIGSFKSEAGGITAVDQVIADIQYTQMLAMSQAGQKSITFTSGSNTYNVAGETKNMPGGVTAENTITFTFNSLGEPISGAGQTVSISGRQIKVWAITGKVEAL